MSHIQTPASLKPVSHYMKVALEHDARDPVVAYWARFHTTQKSLQIDKTSPPAKLFLVQLLEHLEQQKKLLKDNEAISNDTIAQAHIENYCLKLFKYADDSDRRGVFNKNVIKAFYTSALLIDILENFGEVNEEFEKMRKYGKWKAAYIHNCLKAGEVPIGGPAGFDNENDMGEDLQFPNVNVQPVDNQFSNPIDQFQPPPNNFQQFQPTNPQPQPINPQLFHQEQPPPPSTLPLETITLAQKYTKFASSALNFDDIPTAILNLKKAVHLLETGNEMQ